MFGKLVLKKKIINIKQKIAKIRLDKIFIVLAICLMTLTIVSALWNPWAWDTDLINDTQQEGKLFIVGKGLEWNVLKATGEESNLKVHIYNAKNKSLEICFLTENNTGTKFIYNEFGENIVDDQNKNISIKWDAKKCVINEIENAGYYISLSNAKAVNIDKYIRLGNQSIVIEYQNISTLFYNLSFGQVNITLFKNISNSWNNTVNDLFIFYNNDSYKFGAIDMIEENVTLNNYKYQIKSNIPINKKRNILYLTNPIPIKTPSYSWYETHDFDFVDICSRKFNPYNTTVEIDGENWTITYYNETAQCEFNSYQLFNRNETIEDEFGNYTTTYYDYYYEVTFISDKYIDPTITIGSSDWIITSLLKNVTSESGDANFTHLNISNTAPYDSLVGYWNFDGDNINSKGNTSYDFSKENNDGTMTGDAVVNSTDCIYGNCLQLDGGVYPDIDAIRIGTGSDFSDVCINGCTFSAWAYKAQAGTYSTIIARADDAYKDEFFRLWIDSGQDTSFYITEDGYDDDVCYVEYTGGDISLYTWYHYVGVYDNSTGTGNVSVYRDGVYLTSTTCSFSGINITAWQDNEPTFIGAYDSVSDLPAKGGWNGSIDEVMIFNTSLTAAQILDIYNNQSARFFGTGTQKVRAVNITNTTNWQTGFNRVNLSTTIQENKDSRIEARVGQINISVDPDGLVLYMPFEWGSAVDISGQGNDGTITNAVFNKTGGLNDTGGFEFDGLDSGDYILVDDNGDSFGKTVCNNGCTFSAWAKKLDGVNSGVILARWDSSNNDEFFEMFVDAGEDTWFAIGSNGSFDGRCRTEYEGGDISLNVWYHYIMVYDNSTGTGNLSLYRDGVWKKSVTCSFSGIDTIAWQDNEDVMIGADDDGGINSEWNGTIDEVMIFNRALSSTEIANLYGNQSAKYNIAYYTAYQNITTDVNTTFTISTEADFIFPDYKFLAGNSTVAFYSPLIIGDMILDVFSSVVTDTTSPTWSLNQTNNTVNGTSTLFSIYWNDNTALHPTGQYIFSTNNTGVWVNDSAVNFTATPEWANVTKILNDTVGTLVKYRWYVDDNVGNINYTMIFTLEVTSDVVNTCTCAGLNNNWEVSLSDYCVLSESCDLGTGKLSFINSGNFTCNARLDTTNLGDVGSGNYLWINNGCRIYIT